MPQQDCILNEPLCLYRPKKFTLKGYKRYWFVCKDLMLYLYKARDDVGQEPAFRVSLHSSRQNGHCLV